MSKTKDKVIDEQNGQVVTESDVESSSPANNQSVEGGSHAFIDELLKNGNIVLTAKTREELAEMTDQIPADIHYYAGAVWRDHIARTFCLRIDLNNSKD